MHYLKVNASQKHLFSEERMKQASFFYVLIQTYRREDIIFLKTMTS